MLDWWGYVHISGHIQVKRYFDRQDIIDAHKSPFVDEVFDVFKAKDRENAIEYIRNILDSRK